MPIRSSTAGSFTRTSVAVIAVFFLLASNVVGQDDQDQDKEDRHGFGVGLLWHSAGSPMDAGTGLVLRYSRDMQNRFKERKPWPVNIRAGLAFLSLDRDAEGETQQGELDALHFWIGVARHVNAGFSLIGGVDFVSPDAAGTYRSAEQPIAVSNRYDADPAIGAHAGIEFIHRLGKKGEFFTDLRYVAISIDGEQRFVIDGIEGDPVDGDFDMGGPRLTFGFGRRF